MVSGTRSLVPGVPNLRYMYLFSVHNLSLNVRTWHVSATNHGCMFIEWSADWMVDDVVVVVFTFIKLYTQKICGLATFVLLMRILNNQTQICFNILLWKIEIYFRGFLTSGMLMSNQHWRSCSSLSDGKHNHNKTSNKKARPKNSTRNANGYTPGHETSGCPRYDEATSYYWLELLVWIIQ